MLDWRTIGLSRITCTAEMNQMTYAIIETGGKQLWAEPGRFYDIERLHVEMDTAIDIKEVLLVNHEGTVTVGHPYVDQAVVKARVLDHRRDRKVIVYKMKPKKKTRKKKGHRQSLTRLLIEAIELNGEVLQAVSLPTDLGAPLLELEPEFVVLEDEDESESAEPSMIPADLESQAQPVVGDDQLEAPDPDATAVENVDPSEVTNASEMADPSAPSEQGETGDSAESETEASS